MTVVSVGISSKSVTGNEVSQPSCACCGGGLCRAASDIHREYPERLSLTSCSPEISGSGGALSSMVAAMSSRGTSNGSLLSLTGVPSSPDSSSLSSSSSLDGLLRCIRAAALCATSRSFPFTVGLLRTRLRWCTLAVPDSLSLSLLLLVDTAFFFFLDRLPFCLCCSRLAMSFASWRSSLAAAAASRSLSSFAFSLSRSLRLLVLPVFDTLRVTVTKRMFAADGEEDACACAVTLPLCRSGTASLSGNEELLLTVLDGTCAALMLVVDVVVVVVVVLLDAVLRLAAKKDMASE